MMGKGVGCDIISIIISWSADDQLAVMTAILCLSLVLSVSVSLCFTLTAWRFFKLSIFFFLFVTMHSVKYWLDYFLSASVSLSKLLTLCSRCLSNYSRAKNLFPLITLLYITLHIHLWSLPLAFSRSLSNTHTHTLLNTVMLFSPSLMSVFVW